MYVCHIESNITEDSPVMFEFPTLKRNNVHLSKYPKPIRKFSNKQDEPKHTAHFLKIQTKSSRECHLEFMNRTLQKRIVYKLKFHHLDDSYKIELSDIFSNDLLFCITNKCHVVLSCTKMFRQCTYIDYHIPLNTPRPEQPIPTIPNAIAETKAPISYNHSIGIYFYLLYTWCYYRKPFAVPNSSENSNNNNNNYNMKNNVTQLFNKFISIFLTFFIDYKPSFQWSTCDQWMSHVINSSIRAFNIEFGFSFEDDIDLSEFLDHITPTLYTPKEHTFRSKANKRLCEVLNINFDDCSECIRQGYLYLLGEDETYPFKPVADLIQKIKFIQPKMKDILLALFHSYTNGVLSF